jgi:hypothetical protein
MRWALLLGCFVTSLLSGAERPPPWERDWSPNAGECVAIGELPNGVTCRLFSQGANGFLMLVNVYEPKRSTYFGAEPFMAVAERLCEALNTPVRIQFYKRGERFNLLINPPACEKPVIT